MLYMSPMLLRSSAFYISSDTPLTKAWFQGVPSLSKSSERRHFAQESTGESKTCQTQILHKQTGKMLQIVDHNELVRMFLTQKVQC